MPRFTRALCIALVVSWGGAASIRAYQSSASPPTPPAPQTTPAAQTATVAQTTAVAQPAPAAKPAPSSAAVQAALAKDAVCTTCHNSASGHAPAVYDSRHGVKGDDRTPGCQSCHGESDAHVKDPANVSPTVVFNAKSKHVSSVADRNGSCLACHQKNVLPRANWAGSAHETRGLACTDCHNTHAADQKVMSRLTQAEVCYACHKTQRAETRYLSKHPLAVTGIGDPPKMACSDCHNPHGSTGPSLLIKNTVNETCYTCHAEKRGPFLWEHAPVVESCVTCHKPHGSVQQSLLKTRVPYLCQECHTGDHAAQINSGANLAGGNVTTVNGVQQLGAASPRAQLAARACLNCHVLIHGSNHPAGAKFQR
jgi:DmsE family decaheme c-type cytochrome